MLFGAKKKEPRIALIQGSLNDNSPTATLLAEAAARLERQGIAFGTVDLNAIKLDFHDGRPLAEYSEATQGAYRELEGANGFVFAMPVYSYTLSGALKNLIDIAASAMQGKTAGIMCHSTGPESYDASVDLIRVLSAHARVTSVQPIVHTDKDSFKKGKIYDEAIFDVIDEMIATLLKFVRGLRV